MTHLKVSCKSHLHKKLLQENLRKWLAKVLHDTLARVEQWKLQVKSGVSWVLLYCDSDWPITEHRLRKKTCRNSRDAPIIGR